MKKLDRKLSKFLDYVTDGMGRPERRRALSCYLAGLLLEGGRKTHIAMAGRLVDNETEIEAMRQRLQQCVSISSWADSEVRRRVAQKLEQELGPEVFIVDDTGFPKKGHHSVGVARQYSGTLGRVDNCQIATSLHVASDEASGCIGMQLYLPQEWASDVRRRQRAGVPDDIVFKRKWELAIDLLDDALSWGLPSRLMLADSGYGDSTEFRDALTERGCPYLVGLSAERLVWPPGSNPRLPRKKPGQPGRPATRYRDGDQSPTPISHIAKGMRYRSYSFTDGQRGTKTARFAFERVHLAEKHTKGRPPSAELWLIAEHRPGNDEYKFYVSDLPATTPKRELARLVKLRWRVERDYQEMKSQVGLDHFEGRTWRGFHHHATLCATAHAFLALQRRLFPPEALPLDSADGPQTDSAATAGSHRFLSDVSPAIRSQRTGPGALPDVIR